MSGATRVYGVDFSGAAKGGQKIWIASCELRDNLIHLIDCRPALELPNGSANLLPALAALRAVIARAGESWWGFDFPFSLANAYMHGSTWQGFVTSFGARYPDVMDFRAMSLGWRGGRRNTDIETKTPFPPHNLRLFRQTYFGIRDVLAPLVASDQVRVLPMQDAVAEKPRLLEICPASTLKEERMYFPYKGSANRVGRERIWNWLLANGLQADAPRRILDDREGDALDSVIAAWTVGRLILKRVQLDARTELELREGRVFL
ncbi:MAG: hypothetical protein IAE80_25825 [Anaerolinea sp.]|nr:hypothetical protein [Anaerolinea sp.]